MLSVRKGTTELSCYGICESGTRYRSLRDNACQVLALVSQKNYQKTADVHIKTCSKCDKCKLRVKIMVGI